MRARTRSIFQASILLFCCGLSSIGVAQPVQAGDSTAFKRDHSKDGVSELESETLRVLSYNIHMWQIGVPDLATIIRNADADIIGLNEAWTESRNNEIAKSLGYNIVYGGQQSSREYPSQAHSINGFYMPQVLLTKHRVVESTVFNAMAAKDHEGFDSEVPIYRGGLLAVLETKNGNRFVVFVLHLHPWGDASAENMTTMRLNEINGILKRLEPYSHLPIIIIGDFNTQSHFDTPEPWKVTRRLEQGGYADLFRSLHGDPESNPGLTCGTARIDYLFHNKFLEPVECRVVTAGIFESKGYEQSDHLAVFGIVRFRSSESKSGPLKKGN